MIETKPQRWRSRHPDYRFRNTQFTNNCATVSNPDEIQAAAASPFFGRDRDFWRDDEQPKAAPAALTPATPVDPPKVDPPADPPKVDPPAAPQTSGKTNGKK